MQNVIPVILIIILAFIVILFSYINLKKWLTRKQVYVAVFAVILFISFLSLKAAIHYNFVKFQADFMWSSALIAAVIFFIIISPVVLLVYESLRNLSSKNIRIKDTPVSVPIFEEKIDTLPDKRSFGILNEEIYESTASDAELNKPFEKITEITPMEQVLSNIESSIVKESVLTEKPVTAAPETETAIDELKIGQSGPEQKISAEINDPVTVTESKTAGSDVQVKNKKTGRKTTGKKTAVKKTNIKPSISKTTGKKKTK